MQRWLIWNVLFRLQERAKGHPTYRILSEMEATDRLSAPELEALCAARLQAFVAYCYAHVPYVKKQMQESGLTPSQIREPRDLTLLPLMRKTDVRNHREDLRSDQARHLTPFSTGGSTGEPLLFDLSKRRIASRVACRQRVSKWWGVSVGDPEIAVWGAPIELSRQDWLRSLRDRCLSTRLLSAFDMDTAVMSKYLDVIEQSGCRQIFGYPSALYLLCTQARKQGRDLRKIGVKVVFVTSEVLYPHQRELITETFNCPVADGYGGRDSGFIAHECPRGGMHLMADAVITEIVDPQGLPVPPGELGEIVVTDLYSEEFPFLRYATGDLGVLSSRRCLCGRPLPLLDRLEGRANDSIVSPDSRIINSLALIYPLRELQGIEQFRIYQRRVDHFHVQIVKTSEFRPESEDGIRRSWSQLLRSPVEVTFEYLTKFPPDASGKFRHVISDLPAGQNLSRVPTADDPATLIDA
jgi:phenylacetate-CoA ligase